MCVFYMLFRILYAIGFILAGYARLPFEGRLFELENSFNFDPSYIKDQHRKYYNGHEIQNREQISNSTANEVKEITDLDIVLKYPKIIANLCTLFDGMTNEQSLKQVEKTYDSLIDLLIQRQIQLDEDIAYLEKTYTCTPKTNLNMYVPYVGQSKEEQNFFCGSLSNLGQTNRAKKDDLQKRSYSYCSNKQQKNCNEESCALQHSSNSIKAKLTINENDNNMRSLDTRKLSERIAQYKRDYKGIVCALGHFRKEKQAMLSEMFKAKKHFDEYNIFFGKWTKQSHTWFNKKQKLENELKKLKKLTILTDNPSYKGLVQDRVHMNNQGAAELKRMRDELVNELYVWDEDIGKYIYTFVLFLKDLKNKIDLVDAKIALLREVLCKCKPVELEQFSESRYSILEPEKIKMLYTKPEKDFLNPVPASKKPYLASARKENASLDTKRPIMGFKKCNEHNQNNTNQVSLTANPITLPKPLSKGRAGTTILSEDYASCNGRIQDRSTTSDLPIRVKSDNDLTANPILNKSYNEQIKKIRDETKAQNHARSSNNSSTKIHNQGAKIQRGQMVSAMDKTGQNRYTEQKTANYVQSHNKHHEQSFDQTRNTRKEEKKVETKVKADKISPHGCTSFAEEQQNVSDTKSSTKKQTKTIKLVICKITDPVPQRPEKNYCCTISKNRSSELVHGCRNNGSNLLKTFSNRNNSTITASNRMNSQSSTARHATDVSAGCRHVTRREPMQNIQYKALCLKNVYKKDSQMLQNYQKKENVNFIDDTSEQNPDLGYDDAEMNSRNAESMEKSIRIVEAWLKGIPDN